MVCPPPDAPTKAGDVREELLLETAKGLLVELEDLPVDESHPLDCRLTAPWVEAALAETEGSVLPADRGDGSSGDEGGTGSVPGRLKGQLLRQADGRILLQSQLEARFRVPCARCLSDAVVDAGAELVLTFVPEGHQYGFGVDVSSEEEGLELTPESLDELTYSGKKLDLAGTVREQLLLSIPMKALCSRGDECRGLCGRCGQDLNALAVDTANCPGCGLPLIEGAEDLGDQTPDEGPLQAALRKLGAGDDDEG